jgi:hypothetical protein
MKDAPEILALSYALPPSLYPQSIQIGRLLYHCPLPVWAVSGEASDGGMDCYPDFSERMALHQRVPFRAPLSGRLHALARKFVSLYGRAPDEFRFWISDAAKTIDGELADKNPRRPVIVSFGEPMSDHLLALDLKRRTGLPWVAHFSDPWADNPFRRLFVFANVLNRRMERAVIATADRVVFTSPETLSLVMAKYPDGWREKACVLPHSYDPDFYPVTSVRAGKLVVRYLGNFYADRTPFPLLDALVGIHRKSPELLSDVRFELIGAMPDRMRNRALRIDLPPGLVELLPSVSYRNSLRLAAEADLLLVIDAPADLSVFLPSKLIDYVGAGVPIYGVVPSGSSHELIRRLGGRVADPRNPSAVSAELMASLGECRRRRTESATAWGKESVRKEYEIQRVVPQFVKIVESVSAQ